MKGTNVLAWRVIHLSVYLHDAFDFFLQIGIYLIYRYLPIFGLKGIVGQGEHFAVCGLSTHASVCSLNMAGLFREMKQAEKTVL